MLLHRLSVNNWGGGPATPGLRSAVERRRGTAQEGNAKRGAVKGDTAGQGMRRLSATQEERVQHGTGEREYCADTVVFL